MARPHGRASVSTTDPVAFAVCDRCGTWRNQDQLFWQYEWAGMQLINTQILVCQRCADAPNEQLRTIILPPDPLPIKNARVEPFTVDEAGPVSTSLAQDAAIGATTIFVSSVSGFGIATRILVGMNNGSFAQVSVTSVNTGANSMTISIPLPYASSIGQLVSVA